MKLNLPMNLNVLIAAVFALLISACNPMAQLDGAQDFIDEYHELYNSGEASALYGMTGEEFREVTTPAQMEELVSYIDERMGNVESSEREGFNLNTNNGLTITKITMATQFAKGEGTETYIFHGSGEDFRLVSWNVDADNFAENAQDNASVVEDEPEEGATSAE